MPRVTTAFAAALSLLLPFARPLLVGLTPVLGIGAGLLSTQHAYAQTAEDWIVSGNQKYINDDNQGAIADYTKAIEINPDDAVIYLIRGKAKHELKNYQGAIADYTKAIEIKSDYAGAHFNRGITKASLKDHQGAIADWTKAIEIKPDLFAAYNNRGLARQYVMGDLEGACSDWRKAAELGDEQAAQWVEARC